MNTATIRGQKLSIVEEVALASKAGYQGMEPWIDELEKYAQSGGSLKDLGKRIRDAGIRVESSIGFFDWIVDDPSRRRKGLETARRSMDLVHRIGGKRLAAPPVGATDQPMTDLLKVADRYGALLELGDQIGVVPQVEVWVFRGPWAAWARRPWWRSRLDIPKPASFPMSITSIEAAPTSRESSCWLRVQSMSSTSTTTRPIHLARN